MADIEVRKPVPLRTVPGVELAAIGTWAASTGTTTFTPEDLANAVAALECPGVRNPVIKLGHEEPDSTSGVRWDGEPAVGWIANMHMDGAKLVGDYAGMPAWLTETDENGMAVLATAYPDRSIEIRRPFVCQIGHTHPSVITAVALLGVYAPGVGVLKSMQDVYAAFTEPMSGDLANAAANLMSGAENVRTTVRLAADDPRDLTDVEKRAGTDFAALQRQWDDELTDLLEVWPDITAGQRDELSAQIRTAVDDNPDALGNLNVDAAAASAALLLSMTRVARMAASQMAKEARSQGVAIDPPDIADEDVQDVADGIAAAMAASTASAAGRQAAQLLGSGTGEEIATSTVSYLAGLTDRFLRDQLGGALSAAQSVGRFRVLEVAPVAEYYASEVNDRSTCSACKSIDGAKFDDLDSARAAYGSGKYQGCQGGARCRGTCIATWGAELKAKTSVPGSPALLTTIRTGGPMPTAPGGTVRASVSVEDISRQYYESAGYSMWITAMHVDPLELIASDDSSGKFYRVPVELKGDTFTFGEPSEVAINYVDVKTAAAALPHRWDTRRAALAAAGKAEDGTDLNAPKGAAANPAGAPDGGAAIRKLAATATDPGTQTPDGDHADGSTTTPEEGLSMDKAKIREALGLAADAPDSEVATKFAEAFASSATVPPTPPAPDTDPASLLSAIKAAGSDAVILDRENYKMLVSKADLGAKAHEEVKRMGRDAFLSQAIKDNRFPVSKLSDYQKMWDANPDAAKSFIELMPKNAIPTSNVGFLGAEVDKNESDLAYESMYGSGA